MATIINNPDSGGNNGDGGSGMGMVIGIIVLVIILALFFVYGLPALRNGGSDSGTDVNVPDSIDVNVDTPTSGGNQ